MKTFCKIIDKLGGFWQNSEKGMSCPQRGGRVVGVEIGNPNSRKNQCGTTMVEIMLAILILAIVAVSIPPAIGFSRSLVVAEAHRQAAVHAANEAMEQTISQDYSAIIVGTSGLDFGTKYSVGGRLLPTSGTLAVDEFNSPDYKRITISVDYPGGDIPVILVTEIF